MYSSSRRRTVAPLRQPERQARADHLADHEQLQVFAQLAMVALLRLLQPFQILVQLFLRGPGRAVDALEHRALLVAAPVRPRHAHQLDRADLTRAFHVWPATQIEERPLLVDADLGVGQVLDNLNFVGLVMLAEVFQRLCARPAALHERMIRRDAGAHALLDGGEVFGRQRARQLHVIVEAILDGWADGEAARQEIAPAPPPPSHAPRCGASAATAYTRRTPRVPVQLTLCRSFRRLFVRVVG